MAQDEQRVQVMGPEFGTLQGWRGEVEAGDTCCVLRAGDLCAVEGDATKSREIRGFAMLWCLVSGGRLGAGPER